MKGGLAELLNLLTYQTDDHNGVSARRKLAAVPDGRQ